MISAIEDGTAGLLRLALDAAGMRQQAIAQNIANANTPGYQRVAVSFESRVNDIKQALDMGHAPSKAELRDAKPLFVFVDAPGSSEPVALDLEVAQLSETVLHQQALLKAVTKHYQLIGMAINEGKR